MTSLQRRWIKVTAGALVASSCSGQIPPGPTDPATSLRLYATFADRVQRGGLERSFAIAAFPDEKRTSSAPGLASILLLEQRELSALRSRLSSPADRRLFTILNDAVFAIQHNGNPRVADLIERLRRLRAGSFGGSGHEFRESQLAATADARERRAIVLATLNSAPQAGALLRELAHERNRWAQSQYGRGFIDAAWQHRGFDAETAQRLRREVQARLRPDPTEPLVAPWDVESFDPELITHLTTVLDQSPDERAESVLTWVGLPSAPSGLTLLARTPIGGFGAFVTFPVRPPVDVRIIVAQASGLFAHWATLHELGHAVQSLLAPPASHDIEQRIASLAVAESCGKLTERLAFAPEWQTTRLTERDIAALAVWERRSERWRVRSILADTAFEEALYREPDSDLDAAYVDIQRTVAGVAVPPEAVAGWTFEKNLVFKPLARFDYLLARCAQAAIYRRLRALPGGLLGGEAGRVVRDEVLGSAAGRRYEEWFRLASGTEPSCAAWLDDVARAP